jgi:hypothetical protein
MRSTWLFTSCSLDSGIYQPTSVRHATKGMCYLTGWMDPWAHGKADWEEIVADEFVIE